MLVMPIKIPKPKFTAVRFFEREPLADKVSNTNSNTKTVHIE